ncbi:DNA polymerase epsilon subunit D [Cercospora beticola]|uniref:DNA polymerase epsilon subunit D n=1 Tax=Cercospora beticola TaxID=122368 RepID=A0A2G5I944_CERBT|nr:DNA polymerase epsilon subunit D [Cercospora beticola]PIB01003.1 DNA polymerase epsilon subunit D [Cercospora beticola]WPA95632.1 hypothetical protein RHO25_000234 [Cercospora beticola]CAK1356131.1 unnamed protein product [Cercospora beticola]
MPGRKSNVSTTSNGPEEIPEGTPVAQSKASKDKDGLSVEDLSLPKSMVARLAKGVLPPNTQIHKDALLALHKSATVFVNFIASNSNDNAQAAGKKTIAPQDVMAALKDSEYEMFIPRLEAELKKYNDTQCDKRNTYRRKVKADKDAATDKPTGEGETSEIAKDGEATAATTNGASNAGAEDETDRPAKKLKAENGAAVTPGGDEDMVDDDGDDEQDANDQDDEEEDDEEGAEDEVPDEEESEDDQPMEDALEEQVEDAGGIRDEALDQSDSD